MSYIRVKVGHALYDQGWFRDPGAYVLVDGQYGSTGKGVAAAVLAVYAATMASRQIDVVTSNAGPNSGHTGVLSDGEANSPRHVWINKQVPIASAVLDHLGKPVRTYMNGGAVIDTETMQSEWLTLSEEGRRLLAVHPHAAVVTDADRAANVALTAKVASTGKGTGPAAAARIMRGGKVYSDVSFDGLMPDIETPDYVDAQSQKVLVETSQGLSLGINSGFYPYCTHRECTVAQALADARISPRDLRRVMMVVRTFPIRVGNTEGSSGPCYPDQREMTWEEVGQAPEFTTVTKRMRRIFTWSRVQFRDGLVVNRPDTIFINFCNYLSAQQLEELLTSVKDDIEYVCGPAARPLILLGFGPTTHDVVAHSW